MWWDRSRDDGYCLFGHVKLAGEGLVMRNYVALVWSHCIAWLVLWRLFAGPLGVTLHCKADDVTLRCSVSDVTLHCWLVP